MKVMRTQELWGGEMRREEGRGRKERRRLTLHLTETHFNWFKPKRGICYKVTGIFHGTQKGSQDQKKSGTRNWRAIQNQQLLFFSFLLSNATCTLFSASAPTLFLAFSTTQIEGHTSECIEEPAGLHFCRQKTSRN